MEILAEQKLCRKGLHWYPVTDKQCKECKKISNRNRYHANLEHSREYQNQYRKAHPESMRKSRERWRKSNPEYSKQWRESNRERYLEHGKQYYQDNCERLRALSKQRYQANPEVRLERNKKWAKNNPERIRQNNKKWKQKNAGKLNASHAKRRATKKNAVAPWADLVEIKKIYEESKRLTRTTGIVHVVDHVYPLQSKYMCGLHVETNLQILTEAENLSKGNRVWPGQLDYQKN